MMHWNRHGRIFLFCYQCSLKGRKIFETSGRRMEQFNSCEQQQAMSLTHGHDNNDDCNSDDGDDVYIHN
jgi:hypothetical protein